MVDVNSKFVCIDVLEQTPYYRQDVAEILMNSEMIIEYYMID